MSMVKQWNVEARNIKRVQRDLQNLDSKMRRRVLKTANNKAATPMVKLYQNAIKGGMHTMSPVARRLYAKAVGKRQKSYKRGAVQTTIIGIRGGYFTSSGFEMQFLAAWFGGDDGVSPHIIPQKKKTIDHPGIPAVPIWTPLLKGQYNAIMSRTINEIRKALPR